MKNDKESSQINNGMSSKFSEEKMQELRKSNIGEDPAPEISDYTFIREKINDRPVDKKKLAKKMITTAGMAVLFGIVACITIIILEPLLGKILSRNSNQETKLTQIVLPETIDEETELPEVFIDPNTEDELNLIETPIEDMIVDGDGSDSVSDNVAIVVANDNFELELTDYQFVYRKMYALSKEVAKSMVTITAMSLDANFINNQYDAVNKVSGLIIGDNGTQLLILADGSNIADSESFVAKFADSTTCEITIVSTDKDTGLCIFAAKLSDLSATTQEFITSATIGTSYEGSIIGYPVIAVGNTIGSINSVSYGEVTSAGAYVSVTDASYQIMTTNIYATEGSSGVIVNLRGQVIGLITKENAGLEMGNLLTAFGISSIKSLIENMSNDVDRVYLGLHLVDVTSEAMLLYDMPSGAYVSRVDNNSPSMNVGITAGDVITKVGTRTINGVSDYMSALNDLSPDDEVTVIISRKSGDEYRETEVTVVAATK